MSGLPSEEDLLPGVPYSAFDNLRPRVRTRPGWDQYFLGLAVAVAARADCRRRRVGCVIVDSEHRVLATGYNGAPPGGASCLAGECPRGLLTFEEAPPLSGEYNECVAVHAEVNALLFARASCRGATAYVTDPPCAPCARALRAAGVTSVVHGDRLAG